MANNYSYYTCDTASTATTATDTYTYSSWGTTSDISNAGFDSTDNTTVYYWCVCRCNHNNFAQHV